MTDFKKKVKRRLIDLGVTQRWLIAEIKSRTDMYCDNSVLKKIYDGTLHSPTIIAAINEILGLEAE